MGLAVEVSKFRSGCSGNVWGGLVWSVTLRLGSLGGGGVMRGDVRFGRVRFVWAWGGSLVEVRYGVARSGLLRFGS